MWIRDNVHITVNKQHELWTNFFGKWEHIDDSRLLRHFMRIYRSYRKTTISQNEKEAIYDANIFHITAIRPRLTTEDTVSNEQVQKNDIEELIVDSCKKMMDFFTEFSFQPNFRFMNTFALMTSKASKCQYIKNYFELVDNGYAVAVNEKMRSQEFKSILDDFDNIKPSKIINNRFKLYYGSQGTGKTTKAIEESNGNVMVCHSAMLPQDLMEDFKFEDGKAAFKPSALQLAMTEGKPIVLDEINLLPFESLRFLQSVLDGKQQFEYKGQTIVIKDGFKIIGTMNLIVNGATYALPEPLVDRAESLTKFDLTANQLAASLM